MRSGCDTLKQWSKAFSPAVAALGEVANRMSSDFTYTHTHTTHDDWSLFISASLSLCVHRKYYALILASLMRAPPRCSPSYMLSYILARPNYPWCPPRKVCNRPWQQEPACLQGERQLPCCLNFKDFNTVKQPSPIAKVKTAAKVVYLIG